MSPLFDGLDRTGEFSKVAQVAGLPEAKPYVERDFVEKEVIGLFDRLRNPMLHYLGTFGFAYADGEEVVQEAFFSLFQHLNRATPRENLPGWLFRVAHESTLPPPDKSANGIGVFDVAQRKVVRIIKGGSDPENFDISKDGTQLFISNEDDAAVSVVDIASGAVIKSARSVNIPRVLRLLQTENLSALLRRRPALLQS